MNIILEGPDNAGKSTLARALHIATAWPIKHKEGRPPTQIALFEKFRKYEAIENHIIDRHPIVSQGVYGILRGDEETPDEFTDNFFSRSDLNIYCRCIRPLDDHKPSNTDTPEHLKMIAEKEQAIIDIYDNWATLCADIIYSRYEDLAMVVAMVKGALHECGRHPRQ